MDQDRPSYTIGRIIKRIGRGATAVTPAYAAVPYFAFSGVPFPRMPRCAPALTPTLMVLQPQGFAPGPVFVPSAGGQPLTVNPYATT